MATIGQPLTAPEAGWKRYDNTHASISYSGAWTHQSGILNNQAYGQTWSYSTDLIGGKVRFNFTGASLRIIGNYFTNKAKVINISIDDSIETFSEYGTTAINQALIYEKIGLSEGNHIVEITWNDNQFMIDAIDIDSNGRLFHPDEVTSVRQLENGKRIRCHYTASAGSIGVFSGLGRETSDFIPVASTATPNGDFYIIVVDDERYPNRRKLIADRNIQHSISWDAINSKGIASGSGIKIPYNLNLPLSSAYLAGQASGTVLKDLGGRFDGTISGATWTDTPYGKGLSFDGVNDNVQFGDRVVPLGKKSIRFKFKKDSAPSGVACLLSNDLNDSSKHGNRMLINSVGQISWDSARGTAGVFRFNLVSQLSICDGQWHDILCTWDGTTNADAVKMYIDDMTTPNATTTALSIETTVAAANLTLGSTSLSTDRRFLACELAQFEIHDEVVDPSIPFRTDIYEATVRLMSGGTTDATDKDNEWDKYVVGSNLNGTIVAGDVSAWGIVSGTSSWCSTTVTKFNVNTTRTIRGNGTASYWNVGTTSVATTAVAFRPVFIIEDFTYVKSFIFNDGRYKKVDRNLDWQTISTTLPSENTFNKEGMSDLSVLDRKERLFVKDMTLDAQPLGIGKVFRSSVDLKKYIEITKLEVK